MDVSVKGEYALRAVFELACRESDEPVKIAKIAERQQALAGLVIQILQRHTERVLRFGGRVLVA